MDFWNALAAHWPLVGLLLLGLIAVGNLVFGEFFKELGKKLAGLVWDAPAKIQTHLDTPDAKRLCTIPFSPLGDKFAGRTVLLKELTTTLTSKTSTVLSQRAAVRADGGIGKTALAIELGWRLYHQRKFDYVLFLNATDAAELERQLASLCERDKLDLPERDLPEQEPRLRAALAWLKTPANAAHTLLILDNADSPEAQIRVRALHADLSGCPMLITSRGSIGDGIPEKILDLFTPEEAREFLQTHLDQKHLKQPNARATLDGIAEAVDHLPLALEIVASYLRETHQSPQEWLREWQTTPADTLQHHDRSHTHYPVSLSRIWEQTFQRLSPEARALLQALALFAPRPTELPITRLKQLETWLPTRTLLIELQRAALLEWPDQCDPIAPHLILQTVTRYQMTEAEASAARLHALALLDEATPSWEWHEAGWALWERLVPHLQATLAAVRNTAEESRAATLMNKFGLWLDSHADHFKAQLIFLRALEVNENHFGKDHPDAARLLNNLAISLHATNRFTEAEAFSRRALQITEISCGPNDSHTAECLNNLASILRDTNRLGEAEPLFKRALLIAETAFGFNHPNVAGYLNNLAGLYGSTNRVADAEPLFRRALQIDEELFGPNHPRVATSLNNLAALLRATDRLSEAETLFRRSLFIVESSFGPDHPRVAICLNNLASLFRATNRIAEAKLFLNRALIITETSFGAGHSQVANCLNNLAGLLQATNRSVDAEHLYRRALTISENSFGVDHPDVANRLNNLANLLQSNNRLSEAEPLFRRALEVLVLFGIRNGYPHPHLQTVQGNYGSLLRGLGETNVQIIEQINLVVEATKKRAQ